MTTPNQPKVDDKLGFIQKVIDTGDYDVAVKESCTVFEIVFKKIFKQAVSSLSYKDRENILAVEKMIGKGNKGVEDFGFGELVGLFRESDLMDKWAAHTSKDLGLLRTLNFSSIVSLRNKIVHQGITCSRGEANLVYEYLRNLLAILGFADLDSSINNSFIKNNEPSVEAPYMPIALPDLNSLPVVNKGVRQRSIYSSSNQGEEERLFIQAKNYEEIDQEVFQYIMGKLANKQDLIVLDVGCASGVVTHERFSQYSNIKHVIGIDFNQKKIEDARNKYENEKFRFYHLDIEAADFLGSIKSILTELGVSEFDIIFSAFTIHHLEKPMQALIKFRNLLTRGGYFVIRGSDDGSKIAYPDDQNLIGTILKLTNQVVGVSDRENARKQYYQLRRTGFRDIKTFYNVRDTTALNTEERHNLFTENFSFRYNYFHKRLINNPDNNRYREEYEWVKNAIEEIELMFLDETFYFQEIHYCAIGRK